MAKYSTNEAFDKNDGTNVVVTRSNSKTPEGWVTTTFSELFDFKGGSQPPKSEFLDSPGEGLVRLLQIRDFASDKFPVYIKDSAKWPKCSDHDIMIARYGASLGRILTGMSGAYNVALVRVLFDRQSFDPGWVRYFLNSEHFQAPIHLLSRSAQNGFNKKELASIEVGLPPKAEQTRIVNAIESLHQRSAKARTLLIEVEPLIDKLRQSILQSAFSGRLTADWRAKNPDVEPADQLLARIRVERRERWEAAELAKYEAKGKEPPKNWRDRYVNVENNSVRVSRSDPRAENHSDCSLANNWKLVQLGDVLTLQAGYAFKSKWFSDFGVRLLRGTNIEPGKARWNDTVYLPQELAEDYKPYQLNEGDVVIAMDRPVISSGLKVARLSNDDLPALLLQRVGRFLPDREITLEFIYLYVQSPLFMAHIGATETGTQLPHISANDIESAILPLPPINEQTEIVRRVHKMMVRVDQLAKHCAESIISLNDITQSILTNAFRGMLVPQDSNEEPASELLARIRNIRKVDAEVMKESKKINKRELKTETIKMNEPMAELRKWVSSLKEQGTFTFIDVQNISTTDYESLKSMLFTLLDEKPALIEQFFDSESKELIFRKSSQ